jgi:hypothetical protein
MKKLAFLASVAALAAAAAVFAAPTSALASGPTQTSPVTTASPPTEISCTQLSSDGSVNGIPIYYVVANQGVSPVYCLKGIHNCEALGNDGVTQAVVCADLIAQANGSGDVDVISQAEGYCQNLANNSDYPQCANVEMTSELADAGAGISGPVTQYCGHTHGNCVNNGRNYFYAGEWVLPYTAGCGGPGSDYELWSDITGHALDTTIEVPVSDSQFSLASNLASQHAIVCPENVAIMIHRIP